MIEATPEPPGLSVAVSVTDTGALYQPDAQPPPSLTPLHVIAEVGGVVSGGGLLSVKLKSSMVTEPTPARPIPTDRFVAPDGTGGVSHVACFHDELLA